MTEGNDYMEDTLKVRHGTEIKYFGCYEIKGLLSYNIKRNLKLQSGKVNYDIEVVTVLNHKSVIMKMSKPTSLEDAHEMLCKILRYECLFDGRFFKMEKYEIDGVVITKEMEKRMLSYYKGSKAYIKFGQPLNDMVYEKGFYAWECYSEKVLMNQMFYYIGFSAGMTSDMRLALFSEIFEPLSEYLVAIQKIEIKCSKPSKQRNIKCSQCGAECEIPIPGIIYFKDKIESIILKYGTKIFDGDDVRKVLKKTVNTRNKILHVNEKKKDVMTGGQCGFYIRKYVELYRIVVLSELGVWDSNMEHELTEAIKNFNDSFPQLRIKN